MFSKINIFKNQKDDFKLSIIIPTYNVEEYIYTCMDSIINQELKDTEIICVDDCSTDYTLEILKEYQDHCENIKIIENNENHGPGYSRNRGLEVATGEYVCFIDSDDWIEDYSLGYLYSVAHDNDLDLLFSKIISYDNEKEEYFKTDDYSLSILREYENKIFNYHDIDPKVLYAISVTPPGKLYKRSVLVENDIHFLKDKYFEDDAFFNEVFFNSVRTSIVDKYFYIHRIRKESVTHDTGKRLIDMIDVTEELLKNLLKNEKNYEEYHEVLLNYMIYIIKKRFKSIDPEYVNEFFKQFKSLIIRCITKYDIHEDMEDNLADDFFRGI